MKHISEIYLDPHPGVSLLAYPRLRKAAQKFLRLPILHRLLPIARKVRDVAEPSGRLHLHARPISTDSPQSKVLTVLSANLWHDFPRYRRFMDRLEAFAHLAEAQAADVLLLQEVSRTSGFQVDAWLVDRLGMTAIYSRANGHSSAIGFEEGLAVLSRFPLHSPRLRQLSLSRNPFVRRLALGAEVQSPWGSLLAFSVHLGLIPRQNNAQICQLQRWVAQVSGGKTALVGGDFNAHETSRRIQQTRSGWLDTFRQLYPYADGTTHELRWPWGALLHKYRLDYIFLQPGNTRWQVLETQHLQVPDFPHSDHRAVLTRLASTP